MAWHQANTDKSSLPNLLLHSQSCKQVLCSSTSMRGAYPPQDAGVSSSHTTCPSPHHKYIWSIRNQPNNRIFPDCCRYTKSAYLGDIEVWFPACFLHDDILLHDPNLAATHEQFVFNSNSTSTYNAFEWRCAHTLNALWLFICSSNWIFIVVVFTSSKCLPFNFYQQQNQHNTFTDQLSQVLWVPEKRLPTRRPHWQRDKRKPVRHSNHFGSARYNKSTHCWVKVRPSWKPSPCW